MLKDHLETLKAFKSTYQHVDAGLNARILHDISNEILKEICTKVFHEVCRRVLSEGLDIERLAFYGVIPDEKSSLDVYNRDVTSYQPQPFYCDNNCGRTVSSNRYAPHLEKCTGLYSRNLPRATRRRNEKQRINYDEMYNDIDSMDMEYMQ